MSDDEEETQEFITAVTLAMEHMETHGLSVMPAWRPRTSTQRDVDTRCGIVVQVLYAVMTAWAADAGEELPPLTENVAHELALILIERLTNESDKYPGIKAYCDRGER